jgi:hypothetical protein
MLDGGTDWNKAQPNEGNTGESFSKFMAVEFVKQQGIKALPTVNIYGSSYPLAVSQLWLNSARDNFIESSSDDTGHDASTGCGTLFVNFLHYQLGVSIGQISGARGATLAEIYTNLTQKNDGWSTFRDLVDLHYPIDGQYDPPLDNIFPVVDLSAVTAPNIVTWVATGSPTGLAFVQVDKAVPVEIKIALSSDHPAIELQPTAVVRVGELGVFAPFIVHRLPANSSPSIDINLSASYAGRSVSTKVTVIRPEDYTMPPLQLVPKEFEDPCMRHFVEGAPEELVINNFLALFAERPGTTYKWTVDGAKAQINNVPTLLIQALPTAGTKVSVEVVATNSDGLHATGTFSFTTAKATQSLNELAQEIRCRVNHIKNMRQFVPPSDPITRVAPDLTREQLREIETQAARVAREAERIVAGVKKIEALKAG